MRLILMAALVLPCAIFGQSKKDKITFGKVSKEELLNNTCEFDKDAEAMVLYESSRLYMDITGPEVYRELQVHRRIKILNDNGLKRADIKLDYRHYLNAQQINSISAATYNLDAAGNVVVSKVEKSLIYDKKLNAKYSQESFTFPDVKVGSVIEYRYTFRGYSNPHWVMQESIPVKEVHYEVNFPGIVELHSQTFCTYPIRKKDESTGLRSIMKYEMANIPALKDEAFMTCREDYLERIECWPIAVNYEGRRIPLVRTWKQEAVRLLEAEDFGTQLKKDIPRTTELDAALQKISNPFEKMVTIHNYVRNNMKWDGVDNFWALTGVKNAWKEKSGTSGEINLILINLLRDAGLKVDPVMVSTRENGRVSFTFPDIFQFNKVLAYVEIDGKFYVLDGTDKHTPSGVIPADVMATEALVLDPSGPMNFRIIELWDDSHTDKNFVILQAKIDETGNMKGHATITSRDYGRIKRTPGLKNKNEFITRFISKGTADFSIDGLNLKNEETDSLPLIQEFDFSGAVKESGGYSYFAINMFSGLGVNPFISDKRVSDIFFGTNQMHQIITSITIPDGYTFEELPENVKMTLPDNSLSITRMLGATGNILSTRIIIEFKRPVYGAQEYGDLKEFYKKMYSLLDEQVVIKKKS
ncbi:MAG: DUF3857 and transglutaminase domain-containing protein [Chitinophagaceae bacterium]|nr:DUF3857 and transglutaminase domain-containing protein [Chitinophagaceae bacterium]